MNKDCKHIWHLIEGLTELDVETKKVIYVFVCDRCGDFKKVKRGRLL